jgi:hypothetical protein
LRLIVELYDKVPGEYRAYGISTSSGFRLIGAVSSGEEGSARVDYLLLSVEKLKVQYTVHVPPSCLKARFF